MYEGDEEYSASAHSIKKAQQAAAQLALQNTHFQLPEPKPKAKNPLPQSDKAITPTVELNSIAMKLGNLITILDNSHLNIHIYILLFKKKDFFENSCI